MLSISFDGRWIAWARIISESDPSVEIKLWDVSRKQVLSYLAMPIQLNAPDCLVRSFELGNAIEQISNELAVNVQFPHLGSSAYVRVAYGRRRWYFVLSVSEKSTFRRAKKIPTITFLPKKIDSNGVVIDNGYRIQILESFRFITSVKKIE
ncbi:hypothetical protein KKH43_01215 [Patescibacteria group bacterium]|nr:hypothetical protein [Patescibacteria group bacterium]